MTYLHPRLQGFDETDLLVEDLLALHERIGKEIERRGGILALKTELSEFESDLGEIERLMETVRV